jgi:D-alanine-D-alanine ligase-like ATP-grasp enzyme
MDFMYDKEGNPYLLEMNMNPALFCDTDVQTKVIPPMMKEVVGIVLQENKEMFKDK